MENTFDILILESIKENVVYENAYGQKQTVPNKGLFAMTEDGYFLGNISPESSKTFKKDDVVSSADIRWRSKNSGFIILDSNSPRLKDLRKFWVDIKDKTTKRFHS